MTRANRNFESTPQAIPTVEGFVGGSRASEPWGLVRTIDGHNPTCLGTEGSNVHHPGGGDPAWHEDFTQYDPED